MKLLQRHLALALTLIPLCGMAVPGFGAGSERSPLLSPRLVAFDLSAGLPLKAILGAGLDVVEVRDGTAFVLEWPRDRDRIARLGATPRVIDADPGATAAARSRIELEARGLRAGPRPRATGGLPPFGSGSMGGFWTGEEIAQKLAALVAEDTRDLVADRIDTLGWSREGRPILGLAIGRGVEPLVSPPAASIRAEAGSATVRAPRLRTLGNPRPAVFLNALIHAREPAGMQALFYFIDHLLAGYGPDDVGSFLLRERVFYIVPLANPDGYAVNESTYFESGGTTFGMWRKNTRDNDASGDFGMVSDGVDLNRNFGVQWGYDDFGSSPDSTSDIYRGPAPYSEPETETMRIVVDALQPATSFSFHSYSDLMIHAWGWTSTDTPDRAAFDDWSDAMTRYNAYLSGDSPETIYEVNGAYVDFAYAGPGHPPCMAWVPEIGNASDGFWPPPSRITPLGEEMVHSCRVLASIAGPWLQVERVEILEGAMNAGHAASLRVTVRNRGMQASPVVGASLRALDAGGFALNGTSYPALAPGAEAVGTMQVALEDSVTPGRLMRFEARFNGFGTRSLHTLVVPAGTPTILYVDGASNGLGAWSPGAWGIVSNDPAHPSRYFTDSPAGDYGPASTNTLRLSSTVDLSQGVHAYAVYEARWIIQPNADGAVVMSSLNGTNWHSAWATGTTPGILFGIQTPGAPFYSGSQRGWHAERADLSAHSGPGATAVHLRYRMLSNAGTQFDGFSFDSLRIELYDPAAQPAPVAVDGPAPVAALELALPAPNPARDFVRFTFALPRAGAMRLEIVDIAGRRVRTLADGTLAAGRYMRGWNRRDEHGARVAPGMYLARIEAAGGTTARRIVVLE